MTGNIVVNSGGSLTLNGNTLNKSGNFSTAGTGTLTMTNAADVLASLGSVSFLGGSTTGLLTQGLISLKGNFTQSNYGRDGGSGVAVSHRRPAARTEPTIASVCSTRAVAAVRQRTDDGRQVVEAFAVRVDVPEHLPGETPVATREAGEDTIGHVHGAPVYEDVRQPHRRPGGEVR